MAPLQIEMSGGNQFTRPISDSLFDGEAYLGGTLLAERD